MTRTGPTDAQPLADIGTSVVVRGARQNNLRDVDLSVPRDAIVVFTGVSGSGKSSLAFGTLFAESQRRYLESLSPYARRLIDQAGVPDVDAVEGMPPAVALQQQRTGAGARSDVATMTNLSSVVRMLFSRAGSYPPGQPMLYAEDFSANTVQGACPTCHGIGRVYEVTEQDMVPDPGLTIRERAVASWPVGWPGQNQRDILVSRGVDVDIPWRELPRATRDWILFTEERPVEPVYAGLSPKQTATARRRGDEPSYMGTFVGARRYVLDTFAQTKSEIVKKRVSRFVSTRPCDTCHGTRLTPEALSVTVEGHDIAAFSALPLARLVELCDAMTAPGWSPAEGTELGPEKRAAAHQLASDVVRRLRPMVDLGLGYLSLDRTTSTLSGGERQRLRLATQLSAALFGVVYVLDEPSAGLHPRDLDALVAILHGLKQAGNSVFVVEHSLRVIREADWLVDIGPGAGERGGRIVYSGPPAGLAQADASATRRYLFGEAVAPERTPREATGWIELEDVRHNTLDGLSARLPLGCLTAVTGVSGAGKSSLVAQALPALLRARLGQEDGDTAEDGGDDSILLVGDQDPVRGRVHLPDDGPRRVVVIDQKPIGRTPRSNVATYTGLFDAVRRLFAATPQARARKFGAGHFSFNLAGGRCPTCEGEGWVMVELLFLPSIYTPCPDCGGSRYTAETLEITWQGHTIADVLAMSVDEALAVFADEPKVHHPLRVLADVGLGYLRLGQPATELSGGEAQRVKLASELQRSGRGDTLYVLDEPTAGLHPADSDRLLTHLHGLVDAGNTVVMAELDPRMVVQADHVLDLGPGAGADGGRVIAQGTPAQVAASEDSPTAPYLRAALG